MSEEITVAVNGTEADGDGDGQNNQAPTEPKSCDDTEKTERQTIQTPTGSVTADEKVTMEAKSDSGNKEANNLSTVDPEQSKEIITNGQDNGTVAETSGDQTEIISKSNEQDTAIGQSNGDSSNTNTNPGNNDSADLDDAKPTCDDSQQPEQTNVDSVTPEDSGNNVGNTSAVENNDEIIANKVDEDTAEDKPENDQNLGDKQQHQKVEDVPKENESTDNDFGNDSVAENERGVHDSTKIDVESSHTSENKSENNTVSSGESTKENVTEITKSANNTNDVSESASAEQKDDLESENGARIPSNEEDANRVNQPVSSANDIEANTTEGELDEQKNVVDHPDEAKPDNETDLSLQKDKIPSKSGDNNTNKGDSVDDNLTVQGQSISTTEAKTELDDPSSNQPLTESNLTKNENDMPNLKETDNSQSELGKEPNDGDQDSSEVQISKAPESPVESDRDLSAEFVLKTENKDDGTGDTHADYDEDFEQENPTDDSKPEDMLIESTDVKKNEDGDQPGQQSGSTLEDSVEPPNGGSGIETESTENNSNSERDSKVIDDCKADGDNEDETSVSVVVDNDGMPKVIVTTVPDRPPSSQGSVSGERDSSDAAETDNAEKTTDDNSVNNEVPPPSIYRGKYDENDTNENPIEGNEQEDVKNLEESTEQNITNNDSSEMQPILEKTDKTVDEGEKENVDTGGKSDETLVSNDKETRESQESTTEAIGSDTAGDAIKESANNSESVKADMDNYTDNSNNDENNTDKIEGNQDNGSTEKNEIDQSLKTESEPLASTVNSEDNKEKNNDSIETDANKIEEVQKETPLEKLLKRNVEIDGTVDSITELESTVMKILESMKSVLKHYLERLSLQPLKDITMEMDKFRGDFTSINEAYQRCSNMSLNINKQLKELRHINEDVKTMISRKFQNEDLSSWIDVTPEQEAEKDRLYEEKIAAEKQAMAKAAEARQAIADAAIGVSEAKQRAAEMEMQAAETELTAQKAAALAKTALITAQEARKAAEERRIAEEAAKRRAEERARAKAEEEKKKQAQEEMKIHQEAARKGVSVEDEKKRFMEEKARKEAERRNPKNWPKYSYDMKAGDFDPGVGCVIRAIEGSMRTPDVSCEFIDQSIGVLPLRGSEQLMSNIIRVKLVDESRKLHLEEPMSVALPVCINRAPAGKEAVVKQQLTNGSWRELPTGDVHFEEYKEQKFMEGRCRSLGLFAVVLRLKKDKLQFLKKGNRQVSSVDTRVSFVAREGTFTHNTNATLEVQPIDSGIVTALAQRVPAECADLISCSPFVNLVLPVRSFDKQHPLDVCLPLPHVQPRQVRPSTGIQREKETPKDERPKTARPPPTKFEETVEESKFLYKDDKNGWTVCSKLELEPTKTRDITTFSMTQPFGRMLLLRTKEGVRDSIREKIAAHLETAVCQQNVKIVLRQRHDDAADLMVTCTTTSRLETVLKHMSDAGYNEGPPPSPDLLLMEGQKLYMKFRGNISCVTENPCLDFIFNKHIDCMRKFHVEETDKFAQKSLHCYRGFVQVYTNSPISKQESSTKSAASEGAEAETLLTELLVEMSKPEAEPPKPLKTAPVPLKDGPLTQEVLRHVAFELGTEWRDVALNLGLKPMRIQAILRQNLNRETTQTRLDMLVTWLKRIPKSVDKVQLLSKALQGAGRGELADEVRCRGNEFKQQRVLSARVSHLRQAFVKVAKANEVFQKWKSFAEGLGVSEDEIKQIEERGGSGQEKCYSSLEAWKESRGDEANIPQLANYLKSVQHDRLSRDVESIIAN